MPLKQYQQGRGAKSSSAGPRQRDLIITSAAGGLAALAIGAYALLPTSGVQAVLGYVGLAAALLGFIFTARVARAIKGTK